MSKWIKVSDRLPKEIDTYLIAYKEQDYSSLDPDALTWFVTIGIYRFPGENFWEVGGEPNRLVTHWMPFPDPPEETDA